MMCVSFCVFLSSLCSLTLSLLCSARLLMYLIIQFTEHRQTDRQTRQKYRQIKEDRPL